MILNHRIVGDGPRQVVFLHGLFGQGRNWNAIARGITDIATAYLVDLPNHGRSPWTSEFTLDNQAEAVAGWLQRTFTTPIVLVGHSLGGKLAMRIALRWPELVDRLMVVDISPVATTETSEFEYLIAALKSLDLDNLTSRAAANAFLEPKIPNPSVRGFLLQNLRQHEGSWFFTCNLDLLGRSLPEVGSWPPIDGTFYGVTYWIAGGRSPYIQPEHAPVMRALFPHVISMTLKDASHWVHSDAPEAITATLRHMMAADRLSQGSQS